MKERNLQCRKTLYSGVHQSEVEQESLLSRCSVQTQLTVQVDRGDPFTCQPLLPLHGGRRDPQTVPKEGVLGRRFPPSVSAHDAAGSAFRAGVPTMLAQKPASAWDFWCPSKCGSGSHLSQPLLPEQRPLSCTADQAATSSMSAADPNVHDQSPQITVCPGVLFPAQLCCSGRGLAWGPC